MQIDHQKISLTGTGYNQVLVMINLFTKNAQAVLCMIVSAEEICDLLIMFASLELGVRSRFSPTMAKQWSASLRIDDEKVESGAGALQHISAADEMPG